MPPVFLCQNDTQLKVFEANRLLKRFASRIVTIGRGGFAITIADEENIHRLNLIRQAELLADGIGLEHTDPERIESQSGSLQHHVVGDDRGVDVRNLLAIVFALPHLGRIGTDEDCQRSTKIARTASQTLHALLRFDHYQTLRLAVGTRGSYASGLKNLHQFFALDLAVGVFAAGIAPLGQIQKIHLRCC